MNHHQPNNINDVIEEEEHDVHIDLQEIFALFDEMFGDLDLNAYEIIELMEDEDWNDLSAIQLMFAGNKRLRKVKFMHERTDWDKHVEMLEYTNNFEHRFRMKREHFEYLLDAVRDAITVDFARSSNSTGGNEPIYPEMILAMGLRFCGLGSTVPDLADVYGISDASVRRCITMFLDAIDYNTTCAELQVKLPDPNDASALGELAQRWSNVSDAPGLLEYNLGCIDGWLPRTEMPRNVYNQTDYFSGHYQCYGLNVQALTDPDLVFLYVCVAAPGKVNDIRAFNRCTDLLEWLEALPSQYYIIGDNAYPLSDRVLIPFSGAEFYVPANRTYNYFLCQLRIRIEMAFGRLTTKWRICRKTLNFANERNSKIISVCTKLHNFCIRMDQRDGGGRIGSFSGNNVDPREYGIDPLHGVGNQNNPFGYLNTQQTDDDTTVSPGAFVSSLTPDDSRRTSLVADVESRRLQQPAYNVERNADLHG